MKDIDRIPQDVIKKIAKVFRADGFAGASLAKLSEATGLGRSSLYHYFPNGKDDMAAAAIADASTFFEEHVLTELNDMGRSPQARLKNALKGVSAFYNGGRQSCFIDVFSIGDSQTAQHKAAAGVAVALLNGFFQLARSAGSTSAQAKARAERALIEIQGALVVSRTLGDAKPFERALSRLPALLLDPK